MNYESIAKKPNPFNGLSIQQRQRLIVYLCYVATPTMTPDEVRQRWNKVLSIDDWPLAHEAMDLIDEIKKELVKRKRRRSIMCMVVWTTLALLCFGMPFFMSWESQQTEEGPKSAVAGRGEQKEASKAKAAACEVQQNMELQSQGAERAGAKEYAMTEWNAAVEKWNAGNDAITRSDYNSATELFLQAKSLFAEAERSSLKAAELITELSELKRKYLSTGCDITQELIWIRR